MKFIRPLALLFLCLLLAGSKCHKHQNAGTADDSGSPFPEEIPTATITSPAPSKSTTTPPDADTLLALINAHRLANQKTALNRSSNAADTILKNYSVMVATTGATAPPTLPANLDGGTSMTRLNQAGIFPKPRNLAEIIQIAPDAGKLAEYLTTQDGYKSVIDYTKWTNLAIGYGMASANGGWYWTITFYRDPAYD